MENLSKFKKAYLDIIKENADAADMTNDIAFSTINSLLNKISLDALTEFVALLKDAENEELKDIASVAEFILVHREDDEITKESSDSDKIVVTMMAAVPEEDAMKALIKDAKKFNVKATFNNGGDHFSSWDLAGAKEDLVKFLDGTNHWPDWRDYPEDSFEYEEDVEKLL